MTENGGLAVKPRAAALTSVSLTGGRVSHSECGSNWSSATGDCPAAGTGVSYCTVTDSGAWCEFVANNVAPFLQNLVDNVRLSRYVEMRDLLGDVGQAIYQKERPL